MLLYPDASSAPGWLAVLAAFVAINAVMYCVLAVAKTMPKVYLGDFLRRSGHRSESRSIYPDRRMPGAYDGGHERRTAAPHGRGT
jgi:hypothetical protein